MNVVVAYEKSGVVRTAFAKRGHTVASIDLLPTDNDEHGTHFIGDVFDTLKWMMKDSQIDLLICHPPCTYLAVSGLHWNKRVPGRALKTEAALLDVQRLMDLDVGRIAIENPISCISSRIRKPEQIIQPWQFGHPESKSTCLWLKNLKPLVHTNVLPLPASGRWNNQTASGQNKLPPSPKRAEERSRTYQGIGEAMAVQWGGQ